MALRPLLTDARFGILCSSRRKGREERPLRLSQTKKVVWGACTKALLSKATCKRACLKIDMTFFARLCSLNFSISFSSLPKKVPGSLQISDFLIGGSRVKIRLVQGPELWYGAFEISSRGLLAGLSFQGRRRSCTTPTILKLSPKR